MSKYILRVLALLGQRSRAPDANTVSVLHRTLDVDDDCDDGKKRESIPYPSLSRFYGFVRDVKYVPVSFDSSSLSSSSSSDLHSSSVVDAIKGRRAADATKCVNLSLNVTQRFL